LTRSLAKATVLRTVKRGNKPNIDGVDINSLIQQQFHNGLILRKVKRGILRLISGVDITGVDISSIVQQQFHNGRTTCTVNYVDMVMKRGTPAMPSARWRSRKFTMAAFFAQ
jgi:hypothetical protein